jgi:hypothetical protein
VKPPAFAQAGGFAFTHLVGNRRSPERPGFGFKEEFVRDSADWRYHVAAAQCIARPTV